MKKLVLAFCCAFAPEILYSGEIPDSSGSTVSAAVDAAARTMAALRAETSGNGPAAREKLQQIIEESPDAELARWSLGYVRDGKDWWKYQRYVEETGRWPELYKYQQERNGRGETFKDQLFLADGCRTHQLHDEEQAHLQRTLRFDSNFQEARQRLGHLQLNGVWLTPEQIRRELTRQSRNLANLQEWHPRVERLALELDKASGPKALKSIQQRLAEIGTPDAIPALEAVFAGRSEIAASVYLDWASRVPSYEASLALARQAVFAENPKLRVRARSLLRSRPQEDYVPWLLSGLETVTETAFDWEIDLNGFSGLRIHRTLVVNGEQMETTIDHEQRVIDGLGLPMKIGFNPDGSVNVAATRTFLPSAGNFQPTRAIPSMQLLQYLNNNRDVANWHACGQEARTERVLQTLSEGTGEKDLQTSEDWWTWWRIKTDFVLTKGKTKNQYSDVWFVDERLPEPKRLRDLQVRFQQLQLMQSHSCFAAGTIVETEQGPKAIEKIQVGDRVLAQDVETAELSFKPVFDTTVRPNTALLKLKIGSSEMTCSSGHPFWVTGMGWRMAKELHVGARLRTVSGNMQVESIEPAGTGTVHNLVVADAHTYFAGEHRVYTHDVTRRIPTDMILPGVRKEF